MLARDLSKYTKVMTADDFRAWRDQDIGLVIIQAHPPGYGQERSLDLVRAATEAEMPWDAYMYQYLAYTDWLPSALGTLDILAAEGLVPRKAWLDVEDVDSGKGWPVSDRIGAVWRDLALVDAWTAAQGRPEGGIYSAAWYWNGYMGGRHDFAERRLWAAQYDDVADASVLTLFGGWSGCRIKQYAGSQPDGTDLDVLSAEEAAEIEPVPPDNPCEGVMNGLAYVCDDLGDRLLAECLRGRVRKEVVRAVVDEMQRVREQFIGPRP